MNEINLLIHKLALCFCYADNEIHPLELEVLEGWGFKLELSAEILLKIKSDKDAITLFEVTASKIIDEEDRLFVIALLKDLAYADGRLHGSEKHCIQILESSWKVKIGLNIFEAYSKEQLEILDLEPSEWLIVDSFPGTGKTTTVCAKVVKLISKFNIDPSSILLLSFSRAAIKEIQEKIKVIKNEGQISNEVNSLTIKTIDSFANKILYGFSNERGTLNLDSYDKNIARSIQTLSDKSAENDEYLSSFKHVIIDEAQDVSGLRAKFIINFIKSLNQECGLSLFLDRAQNIYPRDYKTGEKLSSLLDYIKDEVFREDIIEKKLTKIYRNQDSNLHEFIVTFHDVASGQIECTKEIFLSMQQAIKHMSKELGNISEENLSLFGSENKQGLLLFRNRAEVLRASYLLSKNSESALAHKLRFGYMPSSILPWIAILFSEFDEDVIDKLKFLKLYENRKNIGLLSDLKAEKAWSRLLEESPYERDGFVDLRQLRRLLGNKNTIDSDFLSKDIGHWGPTLGTIHASKGREKNTTALFRDSSIPNNPETRQEEASILYVGATRHEQSIYSGESDKYWNTKKLNDSNRLFSKWESSLQIQVGLEGDIDEISLVDENSYASLEEVMGIQSFLREKLTEENCPIELTAVRRPEFQDYRYELRVHQGDQNLGLFTKNFSNELYSASLENGYKRSPYIIKPFFLIGVGTFSLSPNDQRKDQLKAPFDKSLFWLYPIVSGMPFCNYR